MTENKDTWKMTREEWFAHQAAEFRERAADDFSSPEYKHLHDDLIRKAEWLEQCTTPTPTADDALIEARAVLREYGHNDLPFLCDGIRESLAKQLAEIERLRKALGDVQYVCGEQMDFGNNDSTIAYCYNRTKKALSETTPPKEQT